MRYFTNAGPDRGPMLHGVSHDAIGVTEAPDRAVPIGVALCIGHDPAGRSVWTLSVHGEDVPGRWVVIDREFRPAH
jgi:hypothetical protein